MFERDILLSRHSHYRIGGPAQYFYRAKKLDEITNVLEHWRRFKSSKNDAIFILGAGTNLLIADAGFRGLVLKPEIKFVRKEQEMIRVGAGVLITELLNYLSTKGLAGLEWAGGLPGTVGGAIRGNAGAFGGEIKDAVSEVVSLDIAQNPPKIIKRNNKGCRFGYRDSIFKRANNKEIILEAAFAFKKGDKKEIIEVIEEKIKYRKERHPLEYPNIGSIFKNVPLTQININRLNQHKSAFPIKTDPLPIIPTAYLIDQCGLKGVSFGGAMISQKHPNFIVNVLGAKASDVKNLINLAKNEVEKKFNIKLEEEIVYV